MIGLFLSAGFVCGLSAGFVCGLSAGFTEEPADGRVAGRVTEVEGCCGFVTVVLGFLSEATPTEGLTVVDGLVTCVDGLLTEVEGLLTDGLVTWVDGLVTEVEGLVTAGLVT